MGKMFKEGYSLTVENPASFWVPLFREEMVSYGVVMDAGSSRDEAMPDGMGTRNPPVSLEKWQPQQVQRASSPHLLIPS